MSIRKLAFFAVLAAGSMGALAQSPPPNDNFTNATVLAGTSITFTGTIAGATYEAAETGGNTYFHSPAGGGSVWWSWTAPISSTVIITTVRSASPGGPTNGFFEIWLGADLNSLTAFYCCNSPFLDPPGRYMRFSATAGTTYQFRIAGTDSRQFAVQLTATNPPIFVFQPQACAVSPYGSAFFSALATGPAPYYHYQAGTTYQWFFN